MPPKTDTNVKPKTEGTATNKPKTEGTATPFYKRWWFWLCLAVALGIITFIILLLAGVIGNKSNNSSPESDNSGPQSNNSGPQSDNSGPQSDNSGPQSDNSGPQSDNVIPPAPVQTPYYPPVTPAAPGAPAAPVNPYVPYEGLGLIYGKRYLITTNDTSNVGTYGYGGRYVGNLVTAINEGGAGVEGDDGDMPFLLGFNPGQDENSDGYKNSEIGFYLMPSLDIESSSSPSSSPSPTSSPEPAYASPTAKSEIVSKLGTYIMSGDKVAIVWPLGACTKPADPGDPVPYWVDHDFDPTKTQYMDDVSSGFYGSKVLAYDYCAGVTKFVNSNESNSSHGFIFEEEDVEPGTPISQLSNVTISLDINSLFLDGCTASPAPSSANLLWQTKNGATEAGFFQVDDTNRYGNIFTIMSVLPPNTLTYGENYSLVLDSLQSKYTCDEYDSCTSNCNSNKNKVCSYPCYGYMRTTTWANNNGGCPWANGNVVASLEFGPGELPYFYTANSNETTSDTHINNMGFWLFPTISKTNYEDYDDKDYDLLNSPILNGSYVSIAASPTADQSPAPETPYGSNGGIWGDHVMAVDGDYNPMWGSSLDSIGPNQTTPASHGFVIQVTDDSYPIGSPITTDQSVTIKYLNTDRVLVGIYPDSDNLQYVNTPYDYRSRTTSRFMTADEQSELSNKSVNQMYFKKVES